MNHRLNYLISLFPFIEIIFASNRSRNSNKFFIIAFLLGNLFEVEMSNLSSFLRTASSHQRPNKYYNKINLNKFAYNFIFRVANSEPDILCINKISGYRPHRTKDHCFCLFRLITRVQGRHSRIEGFNRLLRLLFGCHQGSQLSKEPDASALLKLLSFSCLGIAIY